MCSDPPSIAASPPVPLGHAPVLGHVAVPLATWRSLWPRGGPFGHVAVPLATRRSLWPRGGPFGHAAVPLATRRSLWPHGGPFGHAAVPLATRRSLWPRQRCCVPVLSAILDVHVANEAVAWPKDAGRDSPGEAPVAAVHRCGNAYS